MDCSRTQRKVAARRRGPRVSYSSGSGRPPTNPPVIEDGGDGHEDGNDCYNRYSLLRVTHRCDAGNSSGPSSEATTFARCTQPGNSFSLTSFSLTKDERRIRVKREVYLQSPNRSRLVRMCDSTPQRDVASVYMLLDSDALQQPFSKTVANIGSGKASFAIRDIGHAVVEFWIRFRATSQTAIAFPL